MSSPFDGQDWYTEISFKGQYGASFKVKKRLHSEQSPYQKIEVLETYPCGKLLLLDGKTMVSELDEFVYHESLVHIPMNILDNVKRVLIIGGGDGGIVREFTRYKEIENIDIVEIDERVIEVSKQYFPEVAVGYNDPRVKVLCEDGLKYMESQENKYDIIIVDSTDPEDFAEGLFKVDFYKMVNRALTARGIMMAQTENPFLDEFNIKDIYDNLRMAFPIVSSLNAPVTIYPGTFWTMAFASKQSGPQDFADRGNEMQEMEKTLKWYNRKWHNGVFMSSNFVKRRLGLES